MRLARVVSRTFDSARGYGPELVDFLCDLTRLHGLPQREEYFGRATRTTFTEMAQEIAAELTESDEPTGIEPFGLAVVAHSTPDAEPGWPASYLSGALPGEPLAFAVADQGASAPFTALRIAADFADTDGAQAGGARCPIGLGLRPRRAMLVLIMDQTAVVPDRRLPRGTVLPGRDHAVALVFEPAGRLAELSVRQLTNARPADATAEVKAELRSESGPVTVVLGPGLAGMALADAGRVVHSPADLPGTGPWHELAGLLRQPDAAVGRILLASYEQTLGYLDLCSVSVKAPVREVAAQRGMTGVRAA
jgi:hypothetical protein